MALTSGFELQSQEMLHNVTNNIILAGLDQVQVFLPTLLSCNDPSIIKLRDKSHSNPIVMTLFGSPPPTHPLSFSMSIPGVDYDDLLFLTS